MTNRIWEERKRASERVVFEFDQRSPVMKCLGCRDLGSDWQTVLTFDTKTLVKTNDGEIVRAGPVVIGFQYSERHLREAPHPLELASVLLPHSMFHPNCSSSGALCLGHPPAAFSLESVLHQMWAGLMFNMKTINTRPGEIVNAQAASYVRARADQFPITARGLFEQPDEELRNSDWHVIFDAQIHHLDSLGLAGDTE